MTTPLTALNALPTFRKPRAQAIAPAFSGYVYSPSLHVESPSVRSQQPPVATAQQLQALTGVRFGALPLYRGYYDRFRIITDFSDQTSNERARKRFWDLLKFVEGAQKDGGFQERVSLSHPIDPKAEAGHLEITSISDIPARNIDFQALTLLSLGSEPNKDIFVHVTDPGVGDPNTRTLLITDTHGVYIGPNLGSLGLLEQYFKNNDVKYSHHKIDFEKVRQIEALRLNQPDYQIPSTFHGRDVFAVIAGAIAGGVDPKYFTHPEQEPILTSNFDKPVELAPTTQAFAIRDNTSGNLKLNIALSQDEFNHLLETHQVDVVVRNARSGNSLHVPIKRIFKDVEKGEPLLYLGSSYTPDSSTKRYLELAINHGDIAKALGVKAEEGADALELRFPNLKH